MQPHQISTVSGWPVAPFPQTCILCRRINANKKADSGEPAGSMSRLSLSKSKNLQFLAKAGGLANTEGDGKQAADQDNC